jgi:hypothetical protein
MSASVTLTGEERLAFAGLVRWLVRLDGKFTEEEAAAIDAVAEDIFGNVEVGGGPYRPAPEDRPADPAAIWSLLDQAGEELEEPHVRRLAEGVTRQAAREVIYGALYEIAASDVIAKQEWPFFEWLEQEWGIEG